MKLRFDKVTTDATIAMEIVAMAATFITNPKYSFSLNVNVDEDRGVYYNVFGDIDTKWVDLVELIDGYEEELYDSLWDMDEE